MDLYGQKDSFKKTARGVAIEQFQETYTTVQGAGYIRTHMPANMSFQLGKKKNLLLSDTGIVLGVNQQTGFPSFIKKENSPSTISFGRKQPEAYQKTELESFAKKALNEIAGTMKLENPADRFSLKESLTDDKGITHVKMLQHLNGVPIYGGELIVHFNQKENSFIVNGNYFDLFTNRPNTTELNQFEIINAVELDIRKNNNSNIVRFNSFDKMLAPVVQKYILPEVKGKSGRFIYHVTYWPNIISKWEYLIDAYTGKIIKSIQSSCSADGPKVSTGKDLNGVNRSFGTFLSQSEYYLRDASKSMYNSLSGKGIIETYDLRNDTVGNIYYIKNKDNATWDSKAVSAHYNGILAHDYFKTVHGRNSIDNAGMDIISIVNVPDFETGKSLENAFWNGKFMCYGNGGKTFKPLAGSRDVAGHEMTHGVVQFSANLEYEAQPGAINESMADVFGFMVDTANWQIGEEIIIDKVNYPTGALRSLNDPHNGGKKLGDYSFQPKNMSEYYTGEADNYGVHINSGIPNYAFYLIASNPAIGKIKTAKIYYQALTKYLVKLSQFLDLRLALIQSAKDLYSTSEADIVAKAFDAVGITEAAPLEKVTELKTNPGTEYLITYDTDKSDPNGIYRRTSAGSGTKELTNKTVASRPSVTDNGKTAVFIGTDSKMYSLAVDPSATAEKTVIQSQAMWSNVAISKDGKRLAAISKYQDTSIYVYDYDKKTWYRYMLYAPTFTTGVKAPGPLYADGLEWDYTGQNIIYDCFNKVKNAEGADIAYWDINIINVWNNSTNASTEGKISKLFSLSEGDNVGNPTFSKNSPQKIAFDYFNEDEEIYGVIGYDIAENNIDVIAINNTLGFPTYDKLDARVAFATDSSGIDVVKYVNINKDKISSTDTPKKLVNWAKWPVFYTVGNRNVVIPPTPNVTAGGTTVICSGQSVTLTSSSATGNQWYKNGAKISSAVAKTYQANETGSYSVIVTVDSVQSAPSSAITVISNATPAKPTISRDASGFLVSSSTTNNLWFKETTALTDTVQKIKPTTSGYYSVKVSKNGCTSAASDSYYYLTSAVNNLSQEEIKLYPNPTNGEVYLSTRGRQLNDVYVSVYDMSGKTFIHNKKMNSISKLNLGSSFKGNFIIQIKDRDGKVLTTKKLTKY